MQIRPMAPAMQPITGQASSGAKLRGYVIQPDLVEIGAANHHTLKDPRLSKAVNATFFTKDGSIGDLKGPGLMQLDQGARDQASDKRHFLAFTDDGVLEGVGGYEDLAKTRPPKSIRGFIGGLGQLFNAQQARHLDWEIEAGAFQARLEMAIKSGRFPNIRVDQSAARTLVGVTADKRLLVLTVGEGRLRSHGATLAEAAQLLRKHGAVTGYCLDGGGSTHWWNETRSDGRRVASYLGIFTSGP